MPTSLTPRVRIVHRTLWVLQWLLGASLVGAVLALVWAGLGLRLGHAYQRRTSEARIDTRGDASISD